MGYGAPDSGDNWTKSGFDVQITGGTQLLKSLYTNAPTTGYPIKLPDSKINTINYGYPSKVIDGVTYKNYVWVKNRATYALFNYTPHTIDFKKTTADGGNYLLISIAKGWWTNTWG